MLALLVFSLQFKPVQTYFAQKAAAYLSKELDYKNTITIKSLYLKPFKSVVLEDLLVLDAQKDTLLFMPKFMVDLNRLSLDKRIVDVNTVQLNDGKFFLKDYKDKTSNLDVIINYFDSAPTMPKKKKQPYKINFDRIILNNIAFKYINYKYKDSLKNHVNFDNVSLKQLSGIFEGLDTKNHLVKTTIKNLTFREKSGFYLKNLSAETTIDSNKIELNKLLLVTDRSRLTDFYQMRFKTFRDFNKYVGNVRMKANFKDSHLSSKDVAYFAPELDDMHLDLDIDGQISGLVGDLKAKKLSLKAGNATYIKGDFILKGLPKWKETFMDLKIEMAGTNKSDLDEVIKGITGSKKSQIPIIVKKFGNINFNGSFTGFQNDFIAYGEFKTKLGRVVSDVNMKIDKNNVPSYTGNIKTYDFNIGNLLDEKSLGRITSSLNVQGKGTELNGLKEKLNGDVSYIDFNNYRYTNVKIDGTFEKKFFDGKLSINDKNVKLIFDGNVNLNPKLPIFNFNATITNAKLKALKLLKDTVMVDAKFTTNFSGTNLSNIAGSLFINDIRIENPKGIYTIDSVSLQANGNGVDRKLVISSDILDASIRGEFDLNSIGSYYKAIAKTYIPSFKPDLIKYKNQIFQFNLKVKKFEPIAQIFVPSLALDEGATFVGNFDSRNNIATLNGFIKNLKYKGIVVNNIIIDENTTERQLQLNLTSDRVQINDSLFIKDVNISNILRNDSLAFNVKLSSAEAFNQLDLNGLVEFTKNRDTTAKLSILPSILIINGEEWRIEEKFKVAFNNGKTQIDNFDLSNGTQQITADGLLSDDPNDLMKIGFNNFNLKTLNPFTKGFGVKLSGNVNGKTDLYGALKNLRVRDDIKVDSLTFNDIYIGTLTDTSAFSKDLNKADVYTKIVADGKETFKVTGGLDLKQKEIDLQVMMSDTKLTVLEPLVKKLVTNLKGNISADLSIKGKLDHPLINGTLKLNKGQLMVNYLKTTYIITDNVDVENSIININDFTLNDVEGHQAVANGTVDLTNIDDPDINVQLNADGLMALNTTAKDNAVYYGRAYGTGLFKFNGPTSKMRIDIKAKTEKGTVFNLPLNSSETVSDKDFINFVSSDTSKVVKKATNFDGLTLSFKLTIDPNTTANIYTALGNLSGKGNAELNLNINSLGDFEMSGDYIIETGSFDFTAQEYINKKFDIRQGGTIRWTGNPTAAQINLKATYAVRANLNELFKAANRDASSNANQRVNTEVEMGLTELLLKPEIKLNINFPSQPAIKEELQTYFSDQNNVNLQALSLIIRRSFAPGNGGQSIANQLQSTVSSTATELVFNQFNNVLSSLNLNFVDFNVKSLSEASASLKFFNDRLIINAGIVDRNSLNDFSVIDFSKNNVGSEVEALFLIRKDGTLTGKVANKPPTQQSIFLNSGISPTANVTSLGIIYTQQFDTFKEFIQKITGSYRKNLKRKQAENPIKTNKSVPKEVIMKQTRENKNRK
ncbi:translocation/assembly module TamB domain-containing protein [Pedobacter changchengzhani]|uniref:translocation/assembly module TamB domain-containing protein n=1 Tax=Pedobacter changchengzhani TaxID=2529274 RepID=UPI001FB5CDE8|nr:translocation/assembly module TamB domain-containing protein [Pedobacter changchengzhani]